MNIVCSFLTLYLLVIFVRIIFSWFPVSPGSGLAQVYSVLYTVTEPVLGPVRNVLPPLRMGGMGLDLSPIVVLIGIQILQRIVC